MSSISCSHSVRGEFIQFHKIDIFEFLVQDRTTTHKITIFHDKIWQQKRQKSFDLGGAS